MSFLVKKKRLVRYSVGSYCNLNKQNNKDHRIVIVFIFFIFLAIAIVFRLGKLQLLDHNYYIALASGQHEIFRQLYPERGNIYFKDKSGALVQNVSDYYPIAMNKMMNLLYAVPKEVKDPEAVLEVLKEVFEVAEPDEKTMKDLEFFQSVKDSEELVAELDRKFTEEEIQDIENDLQIINDWRNKLNKTNDPYEPLKHLVSDEETEKIKSYHLEGVYSVEEITRFYPEKNMASHLIGFVGKHKENNILKGYYGIEGCYNQTLSGEAGFLRSELDGRGRWIAVGEKEFRQAENGQDMFLTIDKSIQFFVCEELKKAVNHYAADKGSIVVMNPMTGAIIAMCSFPDFDPHKYNEVTDIQIFNNSAIVDNYEPGSVFKPITMAAALDLKVVDPFTGYQDPGELHISGHTIKNSDLEAHGWQTMTQVLEKSLNTGTVFAARKIGLDKFRKYVQDFGFGERTEIDLCQESSGNITSLNDKNEIYLATASFGQGITVTPIQLLNAFGAIANEGKLLQPYLVDYIKNKEGEIVKQNKTKLVRQVISAHTAKTLGGMLVSVVKNGHASKAAVDGYLVAGKTGTAQVPDFEKGGYSDKTIHTFVGFAPYNQPRFVAVVKLDNVKNVPFSSDSAAPVFGKIAKFILDYYNVLPEVR